MFIKRAVDMAPILSRNILLRNVARSFGDVMATEREAAV